MKGELEQFENKGLIRQKKKENPPIPPNYDKLNNSQTRADVAWPKVIAKLGKT